MLFGRGDVGTADWEAEMALEKARWESAIRCYLTPGGEEVKFVAKHRAASYWWAVAHDHLLRITLDVGLEMLTVPTHSPESIEPLTPVVTVGSRAGQKRKHVRKQPWGKPNASCPYPRDLEMPVEHCNWEEIPQMQRFYCHYRKTVPR